MQSIMFETYAKKEYKLSTSYYLSKEQGGIKGVNEDMSKDLRMMYSEYKHISIFDIFMNSMSSPRHF